MSSALKDSLQTAIDRVGNPVDLMRDNPRRAFSHGYGFVPGEFTNWQEEAMAWHTSCALLDQSHHMNDMFVEGPDTARLLASLGVNSFAGFGNDKAKQFIVTNHDGHYMGDVVLFGLSDTRVDLVGRRTALDWVEFNAAKGGWNVTVERDLQSVDRGSGRPPKLYRYEIQGPATRQLVEKLTGEPMPEVKFFGMTSLTIAGRHARALRHGMAGQVGFELFGPWAEGAQVHDAILQAGQEFDIKQIGSTAYSTANLESGWIPGPMPAIYTPELRDFREWLPASAAGSMGGSMYAKDISEYYVTPYDLGYGRFVRFDHDFVGSDALRARAEEPHRHKVTLVWNPDDVARMFSSLWTPGPTNKFFRLPKARYGQYQMDEVLVDGQRTGISMDCGYVVRDQAVVSLAVVDEAFAQPGTEVEVLWGENPNSAKPGVEPHEQVAIRATVESAPLNKFARTEYRSGDLGQRAGVASARS